MKTVLDLYYDALAMRKQGIALHDIREYLINTGHDNGFSAINAVGGPDVLELTFGKTGEVLAFDGTTWHHHKAP